MTHPLSMASTAHVPDVVSDGVDEVNGLGVVLPGKSEDALRQGDAETVRPHVVEALCLLLLQVLHHFFDHKIFNHLFCSTYTIQGRVN